MKKILFTFLAVAMLSTQVFAFGINPRGPYAGSDYYELYGNFILIGFVSGTIGEIADELSFSGSCQLPYDSISQINVAIAIGQSCTVTDTQYVNVASGRWSLLQVNKYTLK